MPLGKGLGALIGNSGRQSFVRQTGDGKDKQDKLWLVPVTEITPDPQQPRKNFTEAEIKELSDSIKEHGVLQPLLVVEKPDGGYMLVAGERRLRASKLAGLASVPVVVKQFSDEAKLTVSLIENIQREDLNPIEEAFAYKRLSEEFGLTQEKISQRVGKSRSAVANMTRLLELPMPAQQALIDGKISAGQGRALLSVGNEKTQLELLDSMLGTKISVRELERTATKLNPNRQTHRDPNLLYLEESLRQALGTKARITKKGGRGTILIDFFSDEELHQLIKKIAP
jgi:ParB family chromosome partitioning protein